MRVKPLYYVECVALADLLPLVIEMSEGIYSTERTREQQDRDFAMALLTAATNALWHARP